MVVSFSPHDGERPGRRSEHLRRTDAQEPPKEDRRSRGLIAFGLSAFTAVLGGVARAVAEHILRG